MTDEWMGWEMDEDEDGDRIRRRCYISKIL